MDLTEATDNHVQKPLEKLHLADHIDSEWRTELANEFQQPYFKSLEQFLTDRYAAGNTIYPAQTQIFHALNLTPPARIKAVILGQDPYHGVGQAHGLAFSVPRGCPLPPSLRNIFRELYDDVGISPVSDGCLEAWAHRGVLLLNTVLTVEDGQAGAHQACGWEIFTDRIIGVVSARCAPSVFILWGGHAQKKSGLIDQQRHAVLQAPHPSPLSAYRGFFGSRPFSQCNAYLRRFGREPLEWDLNKP